MEAKAEETLSIYKRVNLDDAAIHALPATIDKK